MTTIAIQLRRQIQNLVRILLGKEKSEGLRNRFVRGATGIFGLNVAMNGMIFVISLILARLLGSAGFGAYTYALSWILVLGIPAGLGMSGLLIRNVSAYQTQSAWGLMSGIIRWANRVTLFGSLGIGLLSVVILWVLGKHLDQQMLAALWLALLLLPLTAMLRIRRAIMQGLQHLVLGQLPEMLIQPLLSIILIGFAYIVTKGSMTAPWAMGINVMATVVALLISMTLFRKTVPHAVGEASPIYETKAWLGSSLFMLCISGLHIINSRTDILMLGAIRGAEAAGIYHVANRGSELIMFILMPIYEVLSPTIANLYVRRDFDKLERIVTRSIRIILLLSLPIVVGLLIFGYWFLSLFGTNFTQGQASMTILIVGKLISIAMGPVVLLLTMTGNERYAAIGVGIGAALNVILNAFFIPLWGIEGAALATTGSIILWNSILAIWVYKRLGIHATVLGRINLRNKI